MRQVFLSAVLAAVLAGFAATAQESVPPGDTDARIEYYKARLGGPGTYPVYTQLGAAYVQKARETGLVSYYEEAERYLERSLEFQRNFEALRWLAVVYTAQHQFPEALPYAREAVETLPEDLDAQAALFDVLLALGRHDEAAAVLETMQQSEPGFHVSARLAALRHYRGELRAALEGINQACAEADAEPWPLETRAWCQVRRGALSLDNCRPEDAEAAYQRALEILPAYYLALEHLAELRAAQGRLSEAIELYRRLLENQPNPEYRLALADLYDESGEDAQAAQERGSAAREMRQATENGSRLYLRPLALLLVDKPETAAEGLRWAEEDFKHRQDAYAAATLAWAHHRNGNRREALEFLDLALRPGLKDATLLLDAALMAYEAGERERARGYLEQALACPVRLRPADRARAARLRARLSPSSPP
ncbi:MAG: tetratricopeptide repeat protein [Acidobacteria bacterium]|nr:tetratricopeptide repeat protein [Acidobacteriota bacterium]